MMLKKILLENKNLFGNIFPFNLAKEKFFNLDLSVNNKELNEVDIFSTSELSKYINKKLTQTKTKFAVGGYAEDRFVYLKSKHFGKGTNARTIHIGVDVWCEEYTNIFAPLLSKIHSFKFNNNLGDYGATIFLEHLLEETVFFTLYGHLSKNSLNNISVGDEIEKGEKFAVIGNEFENGNWPTHLHFQIIADMMENIGDFPGFVNKHNKDKFLKLCPNLNLILNIKYLKICLVLHI